MILKSGKNHVPCVISKQQVRFRTLLYRNASIRNDVTRFQRKLTRSITHIGRTILVEASVSHCECIWQK